MKYYQRSFLISVFLFAGLLKAGSVFAQGPNLRLVADSAYIIQMENNLDKYLGAKDYHSAKLICDSILEFSRRTGNARNIGDAFFNYGRLEKSKGNRQETIDFMKTSIEYYLKANAYKAAGKSYFIIGQTYIELKDEVTALEHYKESLHWREKASDSLGIANSSMNVGALLYKTGDYSQASLYFFKVLTLARKMNNDKLRAICLSNLSQLSNKMNNYGQSIEYLNEALALQQKLGNRQAESNVLANYGTTYTEIKNYEKAREMFGQALKIKEETNDQKGIASVYINLGIIAKNENDIPLSKQYINKALEIGRHIGDKEVEANAINTMAELSSMSNSADAEKLLITSLKKAKDLNNPVLIMANYKNLKEFYEKKGDHVKALEYASLYQSLDDSTFKQSNSDKIIELQTRYETAEKERQIADITRQKLEQELRLNKANQLKYSLFGVSFILLLVAALLYSRYLVKKRAQLKLAIINNRLNEYNTTKDKLFSIISHDLKNSVSAFINITDTLNNNFDKISADDMRYWVKEMSSSANGMKDLFRNLLDWAKSQRNQIVVNITEFSLSELFKENIHQMQQQINRRNINIQLNYSVDIKVSTDRDILSTIFRNLLANAVKFSHDEGLVKIEMATVDEMVTFIVTDSGTGMEQEEVDKILKSGALINSKPDIEGEVGSGLGLMLSKELLEKIHGKIDIKSEKHKGSQFSVSIPITKKA